MKVNKIIAKKTTIALNKKAWHDYYIEKHYYAGLMLQGWEVKSLRANRAQLKDSYVVFNRGEAWLLNMHLSPLNTVSTHITADPERSRKLLLRRKEIDFLMGFVQRQGYTLIPLMLYWDKQFAKLEFALAKGKKDHDKREVEKKRDWEREKQRLMKR